MESNRANLEGASHDVVCLRNRKMYRTYWHTHNKQIPTLCILLIDVPSSWSMLKLPKQGWTGHWMFRWTGHWMYRWTGHWMYRWTGHWMFRWRGHWMYRWTGHWMCLLVCKLSRQKGVQCCCHAACSFIARSCWPHKYVQAACKSLSSYTAQAT